jgi:hypothetical protein
MENFNENKPIRIGFYIPKMMVQDLREDAKSRGISLSELVRRILSKYLNKY